MYYTKAIDGYCHLTIPVFLSTLLFCNESVAVIFSYCTIFVPVFPFIKVCAMGNSLD